VTNSFDSTGLSVLFVTESPMGGTMYCHPYTGQGRVVDGGVCEWLAIRVLGWWTRWIVLFVCLFVGFFVCLFFCLFESKVFIEN